MLDPLAVPSEALLPSEVLLRLDKTSFLWHLNWSTSFAQVNSLEDDDTQLVHSAILLNTFAMYEDP